MSQLKNSSRKRWAFMGAGFGAAVTLVLVVGMGVLAGVGSAAGTPPKNTAPPTISGEASVGHTLTADPGTWTGTQPIRFSYQWRRCDRAGTGCADVDGATGKAYNPATIDVGTSLRVRVTATNSVGTDSATSAQTAVVAGIVVTGCPKGTGTVPVDQVTPPARLQIDQMQFTPSIVNRSTTQIVARFHVSDTCGQPVSGALVYSTAVPFNQLNNAPEQPTDATGWATITFQTISGFPADPHQQLLAMFVRARKPGENLLGGISARRLVSVPVNLGA